MTRKVLGAVAVLSLVGMVAAAGVGAQVPAAASEPSPTFSKDVAPILYKNCTNCHRPGEIAPMSLLTYKDARPWAKSIATRVARGTMPPWHADPAHGEFLNDRRLSDAEKDTIARWVAAGSPEGDARDLPASPKYTDGWMIGQPDAVLVDAGGLSAPGERRGQVPVLRGADQLHRRQVGAGVRSASRQPRRRASRDRLHAAARAAAASSDAIVARGATGAASCTAVRIR